MGVCWVDPNYTPYNTLMPRIGIGGEFTSARINPRLSLQLMVTGGIYNDKLFLANSWEGKNRLWVELDCGALYRFSSRQQSTGFIRGGVSVSNPFGLYGGFGWEFPLGRQRLQLSLTGQYQGIGYYGSMTIGSLSVALLL